MVYQKTILDEIAAARLADQGINNAVTNAERFTPSWSDKAYLVLLDFIKDNPREFLVEEVRIRRAVAAGIVENAGFKKTKSVLSHGTPASLWKPVLNAA
jgi:hypothetical protein